MTTHFPEFEFRAPQYRLRAGLYKRSDEYLKCENEWDRLRRRPDVENLFLPAAREICAACGMTDSELRWFRNGTMMVFAVGESCALKIYCPCFAEDLGIETAALSALEGRLDVPTPAVVTTGELEGWPYLLMTRLKGRKLFELWPHLDQDARLDAMRQIGAAVSRMQAVAIEGPLEALRVDWVDFARNQAVGCMARQEKVELAEHWLRQIPAFVERLLPQVETPTTPALLHCELTGGVWFGESGSDGMRLSGLCDFGDAFVGHPEYDLAAPAVFLARGDPALYGAFLEACGHETPDRNFRQRLLLYLLLHPYSSLPWYMEEAPLPQEIDTLESLADFWFSTAAN